MSMQTPTAMTEAKTSGASCRRSGPQVDRRGTRSGGLLTGIVSVAQDPEARLPRAGGVARRVSQPVSRNLQDVCRRRGSPTRKPDCSR